MERTARSDSRGRAVFVGAIFAILLVLMVGVGLLGTYLAATRSWGVLLVWLLGVYYLGVVFAVGWLNQYPDGRSDTWRKRAGLLNGFAVAVVSVATLALLIVSYDLFTADQLHDRGVRADAVVVKVNWSGGLDLPRMYSYRLTLADGSTVPGDLPGGAEQLLDVGDHVTVYYDPRGRAHPMTPPLPSTAGLRRWLAIIIGVDVTALAVMAWAGPRPVGPRRR